MRPTARPIFAALLLLVALVAPCRADDPSRPLTMPELAQSILPGVVTIVAKDKDGNTLKTGSGFVTLAFHQKGSGLIVCVMTNRHVITGAKYVTVRFSDGTEDIAIPIYVDSDHDLAHLLCNPKPEPKFKALTLADMGDVKIGDTVAAFGSPEALEGSMSTGIVSAVRRTGDTVLVQTTAPISPGSSGGPLVDQYGHVVGVTSFTLTEGQNLNFAYAVPLLRAVIEHRPVTYDDYPPDTELQGDAAGATPSKGANVDAPTTSHPEASVGSYYVEDVDITTAVGAPTADDVKKALRAEFARDDIPLAQTEDDTAHTPVADVFFSVTILASSDGYAFDGTIKVDEMATLERSTPVRCLVDEYADGCVATSSVDDLNDQINKVITQLVQSLAKSISDNKNTKSGEQ